MILNIKNILLKYIQSEFTNDISLIKRISIRATFIHIAIIAVAYFIKNVFNLNFINDNFIIFSFLPKTLIFSALFTTSFVITKWIYLYLRTYNSNINIMIKNINKSMYSFELKGKLLNMFIFSNEKCPYEYYLINQLLKNKKDFSKPILSSVQDELHNHIKFYNFNKDNIFDIVNFLYDIKQKYLAHNNNKESYHGFIRTLPYQKITNYGDTRNYIVPSIILNLNIYMLKTWELNYKELRIIYVKFPELKYFIEKSDQWTTTNMILEEINLAID